MLHLLKLLYQKCNKIAFASKQNKSLSNDDSAPFLKNDCKSFYTKVKQILLQINQRSSKGEGGGKLKLR